MADNRVVIKINYDKDMHIKELIDPKMVTIWHTGRILTALAVLIALIWLLFIWSSKIQTDNKPEPSQAVILQTPATSLASTPNIISDAKKNAEVKRPAAIIYDKQVVRAALTYTPKHNEPGDIVPVPVIIQDQQTIELFYFSQIKKPKVNLFFHQWFKNGKLMFKKKFEVKTSNVRLISSKTFTLQDVGEWQVSLTDKQGKLLSEIKYSVQH